MINAIDKTIYHNIQMPGKITCFCKDDHLINKDVLISGAQSFSELLRQIMS